MAKLWTVSRSPVLATDIDIKKAEAINVMLVRPIGILPGSVGDQIRPFAIGLFSEIRPLLKPGVTATALRRAIAVFVHSKRYYFASAQPDSVRHDIDGKPLAPLSDSDRLMAQDRFLAAKRKTETPKSTACEPSQSVAEVPLTKTEQIRAALLGRNRSQRPPPAIS